MGLFPRNCAYTVIGIKPFVRDVNDPTSSDRIGYPSQPHMLPALLGSLPWTRTPFSTPLLLLIGTDLPTFSARITFTSYKLLATCVRSCLRLVTYLCVSFVCSSCRNDIICLFLLAINIALIAGEGLLAIFSI